MVLSLAGDLGTGKTTLVRGLLHARGVRGPIKSPTYALVEHYEVSSLYFYHFDFYRFVSIDEWDAAGTSDYFRDDCVCIVEWPDRVVDRLPLPDIELSLSYPPSGPGRRLEACARSPAGERCLKRLASASH